MDNAQPSLLSGMELRPAFVLLDLEADSNMQVLTALSDRLFEEGMVKSTFRSAILKREEEYCTGLAFPEMGIALPHTDKDHVISPCIAIGVLRKPVTFQSMGMPEIPCETEMVFMLAIKDPEAQLNFLQTCMQIFQEPGKLSALKACKTAEELTTLFKSYFA